MKVMKIGKNHITIAFNDFAKTLSEDTYHAKPEIVELNANRYVNPGQIDIFGGVHDGS